MQAALNAPYSWQIQCLCCSRYCYDARVLDDTASQRETSREDSNSTASQLLPERSQQRPAQPVRRQPAILLLQWLGRMQRCRQDEATGDDFCHCVCGCCACIRYVMSAGGLLFTVIGCICVAAASPAQLWFQGWLWTLKHSKTICIVSKNEKKSGI